MTVAPDGTRELAVHIYVDHAVVSLIAANETALSAWVAPQRKESIGVAVFGKAVVTSVDVWQLASPVHRRRTHAVGPY